MLNPQPWQQFWRIAIPYWQSAEKWGAWTLLTLLLGLSLISTLLLVLVSILLGEVTSALADGDLNRFSQAMLMFGLLIVLGVPLLSAKTYIQAKLSLYWRRWLTERFLQQYLANHQFYHLSVTSDIDNPDQRIAEDIKTLTQQTLFFVVLLFDSALQLVAFTGVLWSISRPLMLFLLLYAAVGTWITTVVFGRVLVGINAEQLKREADFRFHLVRVRENAEMIAFYQGQAQESEQVWQRFLAAFHNINHLIRWQLGLNLFQNSYQYLTFLLPALILSPAILAGQQEIGVEAQASTAFRIILLALALVIKQFEQLTALVASVERLEALDTSTLSLSQQEVAPVTPDIYPGIRHSGIHIETGDHLAVMHLTLYTPDAQTQLVHDLSLSLQPGQSLLIMGKSGVGKSALLRAIAGLWTTGSGTIIRPDLAKIMVLPQTPYLILGTLRDQLLYPTGTQYSDQQLIQVLDQVNLHYLLTRFPGFDATEEWTRVLSIGEQQRLAFARLLLAQPAYALLDEATSALDVAHEQQLYGQLQASSIAYLSIGHRSTLKAYHQQVLELSKATD